MFIHEYGNRDDPTVILLSPMMVSGTDLYGLMLPHFKGSFHFVAPDQGGHGVSGRYAGADEEYAELKAWLMETGCRYIKLVYGASLGVALAYRLFLDRDFTVEHAWFDGVALCRNAAFAEWFMKRLFRSRKRKLARKPVKVSKSLVKMYGYSFAEMMTQNFLRITSEDIGAICAACCHYDLRPMTDTQQKKLHLDFGEKDFDWLYSRKTIPVYMPKAELTIRKGFAHCGYIAAHPKEYVEQIEAFMGGRK